MKGEFKKMTTEQLIEAQETEYNTLAALRKKANSHRRRIASINTTLRGRGIEVPPSKAWKRLGVE